MKRVVHLTSVHNPKDVRIYYKECISIANGGYDTHLIAPGASENKRGKIKFHGVESKYNNRVKRMLFTVAQVYKRALQLKGDLYHFHDPELIPIGFLLFRKCKRVIYDVHEDHVSFIRQKS